MRVRTRPWSRSTTTITYVLDGKALLTEQEDLTPESIVKVLEGLARGEKVKPGPQNGRLTSAPDKEKRTLTEEVCH